MAAHSKKLDLSNIWLFSTCSSRELRTLQSALDEINVPAGRVLTEEGTAGREFFMILEGSATVSHKGKAIATLGPEQYFGELSLLDHGLRSATVVADTDMLLLVLSQREFNGVLEAVPTLTRKLLAVMSTRLRESDARAYD